MKKSRILYIYDFLLKKSDEDNQVSLQNIKDYLESINIESHKQTIKNDIELIEEFGVDIITNKTIGIENTYYVGNCDFELVELKLLVDAVASSRLISDKKSKSLIKKLKNLTNTYKSKELDRRIFLDKRIKNNNKQLYYTLDILNKAIIENIQINFRYYEYNSKKEKIFKHDGYRYDFAPYTLVWNDDYYYVLGYSFKHKKIISFRIDRMEKPKLTNDKFDIIKDYNPSKYVNEVFHMYDGYECHVKLKCHNSIINPIIDKFSTDIEIIPMDDECFTTTVKVSASKTFYSFIFMFDDNIEILEPLSIREEYKSRIKKLHNKYN